MRVPFSTVMPPFASPVARLSRLARRRAAFVAVLLMAVSIVFGGFANASIVSDRATTAHATDHCEHAAAGSAMQHAHGSDGCCKVSCACVFPHAMGFAPMGSLAVAPIRAALPMIRDASATAAPSTVQLRPPIA